MNHPCGDNPDLWFGFNDDDSTDGTAKARAYERSAVEARTLCLRRCPLAAQRVCAVGRRAGSEEYGVWAESNCPAVSTESVSSWRRPTRHCGGSPTARSTREIPENAALLERTEGEVLPKVAVLPSARRRILARVPPHEPVRQ